VKCSSIPPGSWPAPADPLGPGGRAARRAQTQAGADGVRQALNALDGKPVTANIATPLIAITPQTMNSSSVKPFICKSSCG
jgi:hypothetical protein